jgi:hypothetical protein
VFVCTFIGALQTFTGPFAQNGFWGIAFGNDGMAVLQPGQPAMNLNHADQNAISQTDPVRGCGRLRTS